MKKLSILFLLALATISANAQTEEELKKEQAPKKAEIAKLQGEVDAKEKELFEGIQNIFDAYDDAAATPEQLEKVKDYYLQNRYLKRLKENMQKLV